MKKLAIIGVTILTTLSLAACSNKSDTTKSSSKESSVSSSNTSKSSSKTSHSSSSTTVDFKTAAEFESALNSSQDTTGKVVTFTVDNVVPDGELGYTVWAGEHLNFISTEVLNWKSGETHTVRVKKVASSLGSYMITFETIK
ncbi:hypothetical protein [Lactococcus lactis]|uniref:hypothetical protein n=1 Tax=Lactococcus lactis TaxID=1358 RepID=UPI000CE3F8C2|nr:hypothetical protein [Lactococcus lactis]PPA67006.1 hypothetical protein C3952_08870 [Lactococcus lactis]